MSDLNEVTEAMNARYMAKRLGLPQPGLFLTEDEVVCDVKARFDAKDARIAQLEAEVARLRVVLSNISEIAWDDGIEGHFLARLIDIDKMASEALSPREGCQCLSYYERTGTHSPDCPLAPKPKEPSE